MAIRVRMRGQVHLLDAPEGWTLYQILRAHGLPIPSLCEGQCECGTCRVVPDPEWAARLPEPRDDEAELLAQVPGVEHGARLACQLIYEPELDGLSLRLPMPFETDADEP